MGVRKKGVEEKLENVLLGCVVYTKIKYKNQEKGKVSLKMCGNVCCEVCNEELSYPLPTMCLALTFAETVAIDDGISTQRTVAIFR